MNIIDSMNNSEPNIKDKCLAKECTNQRRKSRTSSAFECRTNRRVIDEKTRKSRKDDWNLSNNDVSVPVSFSKISNDTELITKKFSKSSVSITSLMHDLELSQNSYSQKSFSRYCI